MKKRFSGNSVYLLLAALIWGIAFVAQSVGMDYVGPYLFNGLRFILGFLVLIPVVIRRYKKDRSIFQNSVRRKALIKGGIICGVCLCTASALQQVAMVTAPAGKAGFITALYIILVPIFYLIFMRKKTSRFVWVAAVLAVFGLYLLCGGGTFSFSRDELLLFLAAIAYTLHILAVDHYVVNADSICLSAGQMLTAAVISFIIAFCIREPNTVSGVISAWLPILYTGCLSCGVAYTFQIVGQKGTSPAAASVLLSLESCFSVLAGWVILREALSGTELLGCAAMFAAVLLAQIP